MCATPITAQSWPALSYSSVNLLHRQRMLPVRRCYLFVCLSPTPLIKIRQVLSICFDIRSLPIFLSLLLLFLLACTYPVAFCFAFHYLHFIPQLVDLIPDRRVS